MIKKCLGRVMATLSLLTSARKPILPCRFCEKLLLTQLNMMISFSRPWKASTVLTSTVSRWSQPWLRQSGPILFLSWRTWDLYGDMTPICPAIDRRVPELVLTQAMNSISYFVNKASSKLRLDLLSLDSLASFKSKNIIRAPRTFWRFWWEWLSFLLMIDSWSDMRFS